MTQLDKNLIYGMVIFVSTIIVVGVLFYITGSADFIIDKIKSL